jgi:uncharacterized membrane protein YdjX (TVP38/TMEM64 family)
MAGSIGMLPVVAMYVYSGKVAGDLAALASGAAAPRGTAYYLLLSLGLGSTVLVTLLVTRLARRAVDAAVEEASGAGPAVTGPGHDAPPR